MQTKTNTNKCTKCNGTGYIQRYSHIINGTCFACNGTGIKTKRNQQKAKQQIQKDQISEQQRQERIKRNEQLLKEQQQKEEQLKKQQLEQQRKQNYPSHLALINVLKNKNLNRIKNDFKKKTITDIINQFEQKQTLSEKQFKMLFNWLTQKEKDQYYKLSFIYQFKYNTLDEDIKHDAEIITEKLIEDDYKESELKEVSQLLELLQYLNKHNIEDYYDTTDEQQKEMDQILTTD